MKLRVPAFVSSYKSGTDSSTEICFSKFITTYIKSDLAQYGDILKKLKDTYDSLANPTQSNGTPPRPVGGGMPSSRKYLYAQWGIEKKNNDHMLNIHDSSILVGGA